MEDETAMSTVDNQKVLAVGMVLREISEREGTSVAANAATDLVEFESAVERVVTALIVDASRGLRQATEDFDAMPFETVSDMCAHALATISHVRQINTGLTGRERQPWESAGVLNDLETAIQGIYIRNDARKLAH